MLWVGLWIGLWSGSDMTVDDGGYFFADMSYHYTIHAGE
jgi:uncharacterized membrane protein YiaA